MVGFGLLFHVGWVSQRQLMVTYWSNIISLSVVWVIWKARNKSIIEHKGERSLSEKVKLQSFWWLKSTYVAYDLDYHFWRLNLITCLIALLPSFFFFPVFGVSCNVTLYF